MKSVELPAKAALVLKWFYTEEGRMGARVFPEEVFEGKYSLRQAVEPVLLRIQLLEEGEGGSY